METKITPKDTTICIDCFTEVSEWVCYSCREYKTIMTVGDWEAYSGEKYDE